MPERTKVRNRRDVLSQVATFLLFVGILFAIPASMMNSHPAIRKIVHDDVTNGVFQIAVKESDVMVFQSVASIAATRKFLPNLVGTNPDKLGVDNILSRHFPSETFDLQAAVSFENLFNSSTLVFHLMNEESRTLWNGISGQLRDIECVPPNWLTLADWEICIAQFDPNWIHSSTVAVFGWSPSEAWGSWVIDQRPRARFFVDDVQEGYTLSLEAFPYCVDGLAQSAVVMVNSNEIGEIAWEACETQVWTLPVSADYLKKGASNELSFTFAYALAPADNPDDPNNDPRTLAAGFNRLMIRR